MPTCRVCRVSILGIIAMVWVDTLFLGTWTLRERSTLCIPPTCRTFSRRTLRPHALHSPLCSAWAFHLLQVIGRFRLHSSLGILPESSAKDSLRGVMVLMQCVLRHFCMRVTTLSMPASVDCVKSLQWLLPLSSAWAINHLWQLRA